MSPNIPDHAGVPADRLGEPDSADASRASVGSALRPVSDFPERFPDGFPETAIEVVNGSLRDVPFDSSIPWVGPPGYIYDAEHDGPPLIVPATFGFHNPLDVLVAGNPTSNVPS